MMHPLKILPLRNLFPFRFQLNSIYLMIFICVYNRVVDDEFEDSFDYVPPPPVNRQGFFVDDYAAGVPLPSFPARQPPPPPVV